MKTWVNETPSLFAGDDPEVEMKFREFHAANPHVFAMFERLTFQAIERGYKHMGAAMIRELIRWETGIKTTGSSYKISNMFTPYYARLFMKKHPEHLGFFRTRRSIADDDPTVMANAS